MKRFIVTILFVLLILFILDSIGLTSFNTKLMIDQLFIILASYIDMANIQPILNNIDNFLIGLSLIYTKLPIPDISLLDLLLVLLILGLIIDKFRSLSNEITLLEKRRLKMDSNYKKQLNHIIKRLHEISSNDNSYKTDTNINQSIAEITNIIDNLRSTHLRSKVIRRDLYSQVDSDKATNTPDYNPSEKKAKVKKKVTKKKTAKKIAKKTIVKKVKSKKDTEEAEKESIQELVNENQISQIDLARTFLESGENVKASEIIMSVIKTGNENEKHEARLLYMQLRK